MGVRQRARQIRSSGENWCSPAIASRAASRRAEVLVIIGSIQPSACKAHCAPVAARLNAAHTNR